MVLRALMRAVPSLRENGDEFIETQYDNNTISR